MGQSTLDRVNSFNHGFNAGRIETTKKLVSTMYSEEEVKEMIYLYESSNTFFKVKDKMGLPTYITEWFNEHKK